MDFLHNQAVKVKGVTGLCKIIVRSVGVCGESRNPLLDAISVQSCKTGPDWTNKSPNQTEKPKNTQNICFSWKNLFKLLYTSSQT